MGRSWEYTKNRNLLRDRTQQTGDTCRACGGAFLWDVIRYHPLAFTANHILEVVNGGTDEPDNLEPVHFSCNSSMGARLGNTIAARTGRPSNTGRRTTPDPHLDPKSQEWP